MKRETIGMILGKRIFIKKQNLTTKILKWIKATEYEEFVELPPLASLYSVEKGYLEIYDESGKKYTFNELLQLYRDDPYLLSKYIVFRELSDRGYFLIDISERRNIPILLMSLDIKEKEKTKILIIEEGSKISVDFLYNIIKAIKDGGQGSTKMVIAIVERRGGVTYYTMEYFLEKKNEN